MCSDFGRNAFSRATATGRIDPFALSDTAFAASRMVKRMSSPEIFSCSTLILATTRANLADSAQDIGARLQEYFASAKIKTPAEEVGRRQYHRRKARTPAARQMLDRTLATITPDTMRRSEDAWRFKTSTAIGTSTRTL